MAVGEGLDSPDKKPRYVRFLTPSRRLYLLTMCIALVAAALVMHLWRMHPRVPLFYANGGDELIMVAWTKALIDDGWYLTISHLGAPYGMSFGDFPVPNLLHMLVLRAITFVVPNAALALNLYFIAGFPLVALVSAYVLRRLGLSWPTTIAIAVVYSVLPMRFLRNESHFFYAQYFLVPLVMLAMVWVYRGQVLFDAARRRPTRDGYIFLISLFAISWDNEYNAVFAMLGLVLAAAASVVRTRALAGAIAAAIGIAVVFVGVEVELLPTTIYQHQHGVDTAAIIRPPQASEIYALTFAQLVLPIQRHRIRWLEEKREYFDAGLPMFANENSAASLGLLGALGFVGSLAALLLIRIERRGELWPDLARINLAAFLLATIGGIGALISYYFVPELRAYNRISPLIGITSLAVVALALDTFGRQWLDRMGRQRVWYGVLAAIVVLAVLDQTSADYVPVYAADRQAWVEDGTFAATLEHQLPAGASLFQIPHILFPEGPPLEQLGSWDQTALYLQSHTLRYSFGVTRGRDPDTWQQNTSAMPVRSFLEQVVMAGFDGVLDYRTGYADQGAAEETALTAQLGETPLVEANGSVAFYDLSKIRARYDARAGTAAAAQTRTAVLNSPITTSLGDGFYGSEWCGPSTCDWAQQNATVVVNNASSGPIPVTLDLVAATALAQSATLRLAGPARVSKAVPIGSAGTEVTLQFIAPPGASDVMLSTNAHPLVVPGDQRDRRFRLLDWSAHETAVAAAAKQIGRQLRPLSATIPANITIRFGTGCYAPETGAGNSWHWCGSSGQLTLRNDSSASYTARLQYVLATGKPSTVSVRYQGTRHVYRSSPQGKAVDASIVVPSGASTLLLSSDAAPVVAPGDPRRLVIQVLNLRLVQPQRGPGSAHGT